MISSFYAYIEVLRSFLGRRDGIVTSIEQLLNCQKKSVEYQQSFSLLSQQFNACFLAQDDLGRDKPSLGEQLEQAHWRSGFKPRATPGNDLFDPVDQMV